MFALRQVFKNKNSQKPSCESRSILHWGLPIHRFLPAMTRLSVRDRPNRSLTPLGSAAMTGRSSAAFVSHSQPRSAPQLHGYSESFVSVDSRHTNSSLKLMPVLDGSLQQGCGGSRRWAGSEGNLCCPGYLYRAAATFLRKPSSVHAGRQAPQPSPSLLTAGGDTNRLGGGG